MAPDNRDNTAWPGLLAAAEARTLQFEPELAKKGMNACADMIEALRSFQKYVETEKLNGLPQIGDLSSGFTLASALSRRGIEAHDVFATHIDIVTHMMDTYHAAAKAYPDADNVSKAELDKVKGTIESLKDIKVGPTTPGGQLGLTEPKGESPGTNKEDYYDTRLEDWAKDKGKTKESVEIIWEPRDSMLWENLYSLGQALQPDKYMRAASAWNILAASVEKHLGTFMNTINGLSNGWRGKGIDAAKLAANTYSKDLRPLIDTMNVMGELLEYVGRWMSSTKNHMPKTKSDPNDCEMTDTDLEDYREHFENDYLAGGKNTATILPVVPGPTAQPQQKPKLPTEKDPTQKDPKDKDQRENPGNQNPGNQNPGNQNPGNQNPGKQNPGNQNPGNQNPGNQNPGNQNPGNQNPGNQNPGNQNPGNQNPGSQNPGNQNPGNQNPGNQNPGSNNPGSQNPNSNQNSQNSTQLISALGTLLQAATTGMSTLAQSLPTVLKQLESLLAQGNTEQLAQLLGVSEEKVQTAFAEVQQSPEKLAQLGELLGLTTGQTEMVVAEASLSGEEVSAGGVAPKAGLADASSVGHTNLFGARAGVDAAFTESGFGVVAGASVGFADGESNGSGTETVAFGASVSEDGEAVGSVDFFHAFTPPAAVAAPADPGADV
ncbi:hypothetical protein JK358_12490 [Nocardia sp. 2]|uniref:ESX-1 secretion-associated protein EspA/EspE-like domain-containing protein n=1 Tax=Nocardia acididurans TaxID=2802282 RepID=A0ABS1M3V6_9NOCA|nr:hypothetical protein [Nocardia acididurans]MBL1075211.1 hypothetical protein [Nocardia acididurans]